MTFSNYDTTSANTIPTGSIVSTEGGIRFRTLATVRSLPPRGRLPGVRSVVALGRGRGATRAGTAGNVPANTIRVVPPGENPFFLQVNNPEPTTRAARTPRPREVTKPEVDKAVADLKHDARRPASQTAIAAGAGAPPDTELFPATATPGTPTFDVDPADARRPGGRPRSTWR